MRSYKKDNTSASKSVLSVILSVCVSLPATGCLMFEDPDFYAGKTEAVEIPDTETDVDYECEGNWTGVNCDVCPSNFMRGGSCNTCAEWYAGEHCEFIYDEDILSDCYSSTTLRSAIDPITGLPVLIHQHGGFLTMYRCKDETCRTMIDSDFIVAGSGVNVAEMDFAITGDGTPFVVTSNSSQNAINAIICSDASCRTNTIKVLEAGNDRPTDLRIELREGQYPMIAYRVAADNLLNVMHCDDALCDTFETVSFDAACGEGAVLEFETDDRSPFLLYHCEDGLTTDVLKMARCEGADCSDVAFQFDLNTPYADNYSAHAPGIATQPGFDTLVAYGIDSKISLLRYSISNSRFVIAAELTSAGIEATGGATAVALNADGYPQIVRGTTDGMLLVKCLDVNCQAFEESKLVYTKSDSLVSFASSATYNPGIVFTNDSPFIFSAKHGQDCNYDFGSKTGIVTYACTNDNCM